MAACVAAALCALLAPTAVPQRATDGAASQLVARIDAARAARGRQRLATSAELARAAASHAQSMVKRGYFAHSDPDGTPFYRRIARFYPLRTARSWRVGENLYWSPGATTAARIVQAWTNSAPHAHVLFGTWREVGVAVVAASAAPGIFGGKSVTLVVADFGLRG